MCVYVCVPLNQPADSWSVHIRYQAALRALLNLKLFPHFFKVYMDVSVHIYSLAQLLHAHITSLCVLATGQLGIQILTQVLKID